MTRADASRPAGIAARSRNLLHALREGVSIAQPGGLRLGEAVMVRRLHLFSIDLTRTDWYRKGAPPPAVDLPGEIEMRWLTEAEWRADPAVLDSRTASAGTIAARFHAGARCLVARDRLANRTVYHLWIGPAGAHIAWIFRRIDPPPGHMLVFDVWVHPDYRGGNVHWAGASRACVEAVRGGRPRIFAGVEEHEFFPFAAKYARIGFGIAVPVASVLGFKCGPLGLHFDRPPSRRLLELSGKLRSLYPSRYGA